MRGIVDMNTDNWKRCAAKQITSGSELVCTFEYPIDASLFMLLLERYRRLRDGVEKVDQSGHASRELIAQCKRVNAENEALRSENKRLRKIEDAARSMNLRICGGELSCSEPDLMRLDAALVDNPRPDVP